LTPELEDLYQDLILDHYRSPRNRRPLPQADRRAEGVNPLCGDRVTVTVRVEEERIVDVAFEGSGCAISTASASLMTEALRGKTLAEARTISQEFRALATGQGGDPAAGPHLGKLAVFSGIRHYPARVKCATLAWHTVDAALGRWEHVVSTE
jgi:nitrogen fixation NifU-like protein